MSVKPVVAKRSLYNNAVRSEWREKVAKFQTMAQALEALVDFRLRHTGPDRREFDYYNDVQWIESLLEHRLALFKVQEMGDHGLMHKCADGADAAAVAQRWKDEVNAAQGADEVERLVWDYRRRYKPPVMPVNHWLEAEREVVSRLSELRSDVRFREQSLDEFRQRRGVSVVRDGQTHQEYTVELTFQDGEALSMKCRDNENIINAALRQNIILMSECRKGRCATCKGLCEDGTFEMGRDVNVYSLPPEEQDIGAILCCQTYPRSNMRVAMPYEKERVTFGQAVPEPEWLGRVSKCEKINATVYHLVLENINPHSKAVRRLPFVAGQYMNLRIDDTDEWRSFSFACTSNGDGLLEFYIRYTPGGKFSTFLEGLHIGNEVQMRGPYGMFHLRQGHHARRILVAGNTGISPLLAFLRQMAQDRDSTETHLLFGVTNHHALFLQNEFSALQATLPKLTVHYCFSQPEAGRSGDGDVVSMLQHLHSGSHVPADVYVCGSDRFVSGAMAACKDLGVDLRDVITERYLPRV